MASNSIQLVCMTGMSMALTRTPVRLERGPELRILCQAGTVWISEYPSREDHVLAVGDAVQLHGNRDIVMSGLPRARVALIPEPRYE